MTKQKFDSLADTYKPWLLRFANSYLRDSTLVESVVSETICRARKICRSCKDTDELRTQLLRIGGAVIRRWLKKCVHNMEKKPSPQPTQQENQQKPWHHKTVAELLEPPKKPCISVVYAPLASAVVNTDLAALYEELIARGVLLRDLIESEKDGAA